MAIIRKIRSIFRSTVGRVLDLWVKFHIVNHVIPMQIQLIQDIIKGGGGGVVRREVTSYGDESILTAAADPVEAMMQRMATWTVYGRGLSDWRSLGFRIFIPIFIAEMSLRRVQRLRRGRISRIKLRLLMRMVTLGRGIAISFVVMPPLYFFCDEFVRELNIELRLAGID